MGKLDKLDGCVNLLLSGAIRGHIVLSHYIQLKETGRPFTNSSAGGEGKEVPCIKMKQ